MALGDTIGLSIPRSPGAWWLLSGALRLNLSDRAAVTVSGGGMPAAGSPMQPQLFTVTLRPRGRGESLSDLRRDLVVYCRDQTILRYQGVTRTVELSCTYVDGLEDLSPRFLARDPRWRLWVDEGAGESYPSGSWLLADGLEPIGTAPAPIALSAVGPGSIAWITLHTTDELRLTLSGVNLAAAQWFYILTDRLLIYSSPDGYGLGNLAPGSKLASFQLMPGLYNGTAALATTADVRYAYIPRFWFWSDADV